MIRINEKIKLTRHKKTQVLGPKAVTKAVRTSYWILKTVRHKNG